MQHSLWLSAHPSISCEVYDEVRRCVDLEGLSEHLILTVAKLALDDDGTLSRFQLRGPNASSVLSKIIHRSYQYYTKTTDYHHPNRCSEPSNNKDDDDITMLHRSLHKLLNAKNLSK